MIRRTLRVAVWAAVFVLAGRAWTAETPNAPASLDGKPAGASKAFDDLVLYAPGHFGNSYEAAGEAEMGALLEEAKHWGFNRYADWFNMDDCVDPFPKSRVVKLSHAVWESKKRHFRAAMARGLPCDLAITPNHVYIDQCRPEWAAEQSDRIFGQLICPSKPEARQAILANYENLFRDLARSGVRLSAVVAAPYDYGGCACARCQPWILTFAKLSREIHKLGLRYYPRLEMHMIGWWWQPAEHKEFAEWADREAPDWIRRLYLWIPYGQTTVGQVPLPKGCQVAAFVHIGYGDLPGQERYFHLGPVIAPARLEKTVADLKSRGCRSLMAYSEGVFDDVNKALLAGLASGRFAKADDVLSAYAMRYLRAEEPPAAVQWARWLRAWGQPFQVNAEQAHAELTRLPGASAPVSWRREQWRLKCELFRLHARIMQGSNWTPQRLALVDQFWATQEELYRKVWGLGPVRHIFERRYTPLPWYQSWAKHQAELARGIGAQQ